MNTITTDTRRTRTARIASPATKPVPAVPAAAADPFDMYAEEGGTVVFWIDGEDSSQRVTLPLASALTLASRLAGLVADAYAGRAKIQPAIQRVPGTGGERLDALAEGAGTPDETVLFSFAAERGMGITGLLTVDEAEEFGCHLLDVVKFMRDARGTR